MKKEGKFIVLEGGVGCGKTTQFKKFQRDFPGWKFYREPGGTAFGEKVRDAVQGLYDYEVEPYASFFAYSAARANLVRSVIIPELSLGHTILLDRYWYSTYSYQGTEGVLKKDIRFISQIATKGLTPQVVLYYDVLPEIGMSRKAGKKDSDRYDVKQLEFHSKVRSNYLRLAKLYTANWYIIDASRPVEEVYDASLEVLKKAGVL